MILIQYPTIPNSSRCERVDRSARILGDRIVALSKMAAIWHYAIGPEVCLSHSVSLLLVVPFRVVVRCLFVLRMCCAYRIS